MKTKADPFKSGHSFYLVLSPSSIYKGGPAGIILGFFVLYACYLLATEVFLEFLLNTCLKCCKKVPENPDELIDLY